MLIGDVIAAVEISDSLARVIITELNESEELIFVSHSEKPSRGIQNGMIVNIEEASKIIQEVIMDAEFQAGRTVTDLWVSIGGDNVECINSRGAVPISGKNGEINQADMERVIRNSTVIPIPMDRMVLHNIPQQFVVDQHQIVDNPLNIRGIRLESEVQICTARVSAVENLQLAFERTQYKINKMIYNGYCNIEAVLSTDEKRLGVLLIDISSQFSDFVLLQNGVQVFTGSIPIGGYFASSDVTQFVKTSFSDAEKIKIQSGSCWKENVDPEKQVIFPGIVGQKHTIVNMEDFAMILQSRYEEIFKIIRKKIILKYGNYKLAGGIVLTGGGVLIDGIEQLATHMFGVPARVGKPLGLKGLPQECLNPAWSTVAGLIKIGHRENNSNNKSVNSMITVANMKSFLNWFKHLF